RALDQNGFWPNRSHSHYTPLLYMPLVLHVRLKCTGSAIWEAKPIIDRGSKPLTIIIRLYFSIAYIDALRVCWFVVVSFYSYGTVKSVNSRRPAESACFVKV